MLGESNRGQQKKSMQPSVDTSAVVWRSPIMPCSLMFGYRSIVALPFALGSASSFTLTARPAGAHHPRGMIAHDSWLVDGPRHPYRVMTGQRRTHMVGATTGPARRFTVAAGRAERTWRP